MANNSDNSNDEISSGMEHSSAGLNNIKMEKQDDKTVQSAGSIPEDEENLDEAQLDEEQIDEERLDEERLDEEHIDDEQLDEEDDDDDDGIEVTIGDVSSVINSNLKMKQRQTPQVAKPKAGIDLETTGEYQGKPILDVNLDQLEDKPWRKPGADISDYFNYGFNEDTWKAYCDHQKKMRSHANNDSGGEVSNNDTFNSMSQINQPEIVDMSPSQIPIATVNENSKYAALMQPMKKVGPLPGRRTGYIDLSNKPPEALPVSRGIPVIVSQSRTLREMEMHAEELERQRVEQEQAKRLNMEQRRHDQEMMRRQHMERQQMWHWEQEQKRQELEKQWQIERAEREEQELREKQKQREIEELEIMERERERERRERDKDRDKERERERERERTRERGVKRSHERDRDRDRDRSERKSNKDRSGQSERSDKDNGEGDSRSKKRREKSKDRTLSSQKKHFDKDKEKKRKTK